jgi:hypothetical protein
MQALALACSLSFVSLAVCKQSPTVSALKPFGALLIRDLTWLVQIGVFMFVSARMYVFVDNSQTYVVRQKSSVGRRIRPRNFRNPPRRRLTVYETFYRFGFVVLVLYLSRIKPLLPL